MNLLETLELEGLRTQKSPLIERTLGMDALLKEIFRYARNEDRDLDATKEEWGDKFLASKRFTLTEILTNKVANPGRREPQVMQRIMAQGFEHPVVVDYNKNKIAVVSSINYVPRAIVVDGREKFAIACRAGTTRIKAWVGEKIIESVRAQALVEPQIITPEIYKSGTINSVLRLMHACSATCGCAMAAKKDACSIGACTMFTKGDRRVTLKDMIKISAGMKGSKRAKIRAVSPPGWEDTVKHMKDHEDIDNPYALAWYGYNEGFTPHAGDKK